MNRLPHPRSRQGVFAVAAAFGLSILAASMFFAGLAQAFTIDNQSGGTNSAGSAKYTDPDSRLSGNGSGSTGPKYNFGNTTLQFGTQRSGSDLRYDKDRMFNPNGAPSGER